MYYTDGYIYRLKRRTTETTGVLYNQPRDKGAKKWPHRGASKSDIIQLRKVASHAVRSEMHEPAKSRVVIRFFWSMRHGGKVREKVHIMQRPFLNL